MKNFKEAILLEEERRYKEFSNKELSSCGIFLPSEEEKIKLIALIESLIIPHQNLLFLYYGYNHSYDEIEEILGIENAKGLHRFISSYLAELLGYTDKYIIDSSLKQVSILAMGEIDKKDQKVYGSCEKTYYNNKKKRILSCAFFRNKVASFILVALISGTLLLGINAFANGKLFEFILERSREYTSFLYKSADGADTIKRSNNYLNVDNISSYIPKRFSETKNFNACDVKIVIFKSDEGDKIIIKANLENQRTYLNTEDDTIEEVSINGNNTYIWSKNNTYFLVSSKNNISYQIVGDISREEILEINRGLTQKTK